jgi:hypothetical protein
VSSTKWEKDRAETALSLFYLIASSSLFSFRYHHDSGLSHIEEKQVTFAERNVS